MGQGRLLSVERKDGEEAAENVQLFQEHGL